MKKFLKSAFITCSVVFAMSALTSCGEEATGLDVDPDKELTDQNSASFPAAEYPVVRNITAEKGSTVDFTVEFAEAETKMYRLYVSQNIYGSEEGTIAYDLESKAVNIDTKSDGSLDLEKSEIESFSKKLPLVAPTETGGVTSYKIWVTGGSAFSSGKGDFRNTEKNNAYKNKDAYITVNITAGTPTIKAKAIKTFTATILGAPLADGTSRTFMSVYNGQKYAMKGAKESAALWDFGYFYGTTVGASIRSLSDFPKIAIDIPKVSGIAKANLNTFFVKKSTNFDEAKFNSVTVAELNTIATPTTTKVDGLIAGNVLEFQDAYGTKGLIKVTKVVKGNGTAGKITFDVKVQDLSVNL